MFNRVRALLLILSLSFLPAARAAAQAEPAGWQFMFLPYFTAPHMNGTTGLGPLSTKVDASPSDIFSNLQFGLMGDFMAVKGPWAFNLNGLYMDLSKDGADLPTSVSMDQGMIELTALRKVTPALQVLAGLRYDWLGSQFEVNGNVAQRLEIDEDWVDPFLGARVELPHTGRWRVWGRGDIGGFGIGSQFTWQARVGVGYRLSKLLELDAAYWAIGIDYENDDATLPFTYDMTTFGPQLGIGFHF